ncbi:unknown [Roseburia sp. CAG:471]|nr:unknown [Roseburia sp. CAG:471]
MFVVDISLYIMDVQVIEFDLMQGSVILCDHGYTGAVHAICLVQAFIFDAGIVGDFQIPDGNVLCIV